MKNKISTILYFHYLAQVLIIGTPLILQTYLIRVLGIGSLSDLNIVMAYFSICLAASSGLTYFFMEELRIKGVDHLPILIGFHFLLACFIVLIYIVGLIFINPNLFKSSLFLVIPILTSSLSCDYYFYHKLKSKFIFYRKLISRLLLVSLSIQLIKSPQDAAVYIFIFAFIMVAENLYNYFHIKKPLLINFYYFRKNIINGLLGGGVQFVYNQISNMAILILGSTKENQSDNLNEVLIVILRVVNSGLSFVTSVSSYVLSLINSGRLKTTVVYPGYFLFGLLSFIGYVLLEDLIFLLFAPGHILNSYDYMLIGTLLIVHPLTNQILLNLYFSKADFIPIILVYSVQLLMFKLMQPFLTLPISFAILNFLLFFFFIMLNKSTIRKEII